MHFTDRITRLNDVPILIGHGRQQCADGFDLGLGEALVAGLVGRASRQVALRAEIAGLGILNQTVLDAVELVALGFDNGIDLADQRRGNIGVLRP